MNTAYQFLQEGISRANTLATAYSNSKFEIWVRAGTYHPNASANPPSGGTNNRAASFLMRDRVALLAGFAGGEITKNQRKPFVNITTLSGNLGSFGSSHHVVSAVAGTSLPISSESICDGFVITAGDADQTEAEPFQHGGGVYISGTVGASVNCSPTFSRCRIEGNRGEEGGGVYIKVGQSSTPTFAACTFSGNTATSDGGGAFIRGLGNAVPPKPVFINSLFYDNAAHGTSGADGVGEGGAVYSDIHGAPTLINCTITRNAGTTVGPVTGAGGVHQQSDCNSGPIEGVENSGPEIHNCIVFNNTGPELAGENITWNSTIGDSGGGICEENGPQPPSSAGNDFDDPLFVNASTDFHLTSESPAIDHGDNRWLIGFTDHNDINQNGNLTEIYPDLDTRGRFAGTSTGGTTGLNGCEPVDRGAYEYQSTLCLGDVAPSPGGNGAVNVNDLLTVITTWGPCAAIPAACAADIAPTPCGDRTVGVADLLMVIANWGTCEAPIGYLPQTYEDCHDRCSGLSGQAYWDCMHKCFDMLCATGHPEYCPD